MSAEENKAMVRRIVEEALNKGDLAVVDEVIADSYIYHVPGNEIEGPEGFKQYVNMMRTALPDLNITVDNMVAEGDMVASRFTVRGTHRGELLGIAPTGRQVAITEAIFIHFEDGKEVEAWVYTNMLAIYQQLGVNPPS